jgi:hypothetical protein
VFLLFYFKIRGPLLTKIAIAVFQGISFVVVKVNTMSTVNSMIVNL